MKKLKLLLIPLLVGIVFTVALKAFLSSQIDGLLSTKDVRPMLYEPVSVIKDKGIAANNYWAKNGYIMMMGSSELSHSTVQHPVYFFNTGRSKDMVVPIGRAYTQSLQDATLIGALDKASRENMKLVILVSMQWFLDEEGVSPHHFQTRFSPILYYKFMESDDISRESKMRFAQRVNGLLSQKPGEFRPELVHSQMFLKENDGKFDPEDILGYALKPYFYLRRYAVELKDDGLTFKQTFKQSDRNYKLGKRKDIDWDEENEKAIEMAKKRVDDNPLNVDKMYYRKYIKGKMKKFRGMYKDVNMLESKEFSDFDFLMQVCKEADVKPIVVGIPAMDKFYDATGISRSEREKYYNKLGNTVKKYGYDYIDLRDKGREKYYLRDVMHLGTKGWVDVNERIYKKFDE